MSVRISVSDENGSLAFQDLDGNPLPSNLIAEIKKQHGEAVRGLIAETCAKVNEPIEALSKIHLDTPDPRAPRYVPASFGEPAPQTPAPKPISFLDRILFRRARIEQANAAVAGRYRQEKANWEARKAEFIVRERARELFIEQQVLTDESAMEKHLEATLQDIVWPRETLVSFDIQDGGKTVLLDVDLPEIEHMPNRTAVVPQREWKLAVKPMTATQVQKLYMAHIHGVGVRIIGEVFAALPTVAKVVLSAYSQRANVATGVIADEYLYSVQVTREQWLTINFANWASVDVIEVLAAFDLRRTMTKTGVFKPVEPFAA